MISARLLGVGVQERYALVPPVTDCDDALAFTVPLEVIDAAGDDLVLSFEGAILTDDVPDADLA